jgi:ribonuclease HI
VAEQDTLAEVCSLERELLDPHTRRDPGRVGRLLHPDFLEIGASGAVWDRDALLAELSRDPGEPPEVVDLAASEIAPGVVLLTYLAYGGAASRRSSLWVRGEDGRWRVRFHQGTRTDG